MAITTTALDVPFDEINPKAKKITNSSKHPHGGASRRLVKINFAANEGSECSSKVKRVKLKKCNEGQSPYLMGDTIHSVTVERFIEKTLVHKKVPDYSSFPLAANLYKASSDEFKNLKKKPTRKVKKSVLTLPNNPTPIPQLCTVSDMNDSDNSLKKLKKKPANVRNKKSPVGIFRKNRCKPKEIGFYDRDAQYCTELNIDLDCSSTEIIKTSRGGRNKLLNNVRKPDDNNNADLKNVWEVLRDINRFQFRPSPPMSEDSYVAPAKKKGQKRHNNIRKDVRLVESTRAEEYAYISRVDVNRRAAISSKTFIPSINTSLDKITVINKSNELCNTNQGFDKKLKPPLAMNGAYNRLPLHNNKFGKRNCDRAISRKLNNFNHIKPCHKITPENNFDRKNILEDIEYSSTSTFGHEFDNSFYSKDNKGTNDCNYKVPEPMELIYSENSGSSKAGLALEKEKVNNKKPTAGRYSPNARPRQIPDGCNNHQKLNLSEIKRRVAKLKFPIVVLGKDQLSSSYERVSHEFSQFSGLEEAVWPFMLTWDEKEKHSQQQSTKHKNYNNLKNKSSGFNGYRKTDKINDEFSTINRDFFNKEKNVMEPKVFNRANKAIQKRITPPEELDTQLKQEPTKHKHIRQFKNKMLKLLYKSSSSQSSVGENKASIKRFTKKKSNHNPVNNKVDSVNDACVVKDPYQVQIVNPMTLNKPTTHGKLPWAKGRWASEFIENVIKKIKTGVYYSTDNKTANKITAREAEIQTISVNDTIIPESYETQPISKVSITKPKQELLFIIPGFEEDNILPKLEIKSMNMNEICVKHCTTNIMVRFDVTLPTEPMLNSTKSNALVPLRVTDSHTKVFKCKTNIINAMLPEELCSVLPSIMCDLKKSTDSIAHPLPISKEKVGFHLKPFTEVSGIKSPETLISRLPFRHFSKELNLLLDGSYSMLAVLCLKFKIYESPRLKFSNFILILDLLPRLQRSHFFNCDLDPIIPPVLMKSEEQVPVSSLPSVNQMECKALQLYPAANRKLIPRFNRFDLAGILENISRLAQRNLSQIQRSPWIDSLLSNGVSSIKLTAISPNGFHNSIMFDVSKLSNTVFSPNQNSDAKVDIRSHSLDVARPRSFAIKTESVTKTQNQVLVSNNKIKLRRYVKLYRKSKSVSNISGGRHTTPLSRIGNLDDFFLALGSGKMLASAFDQFGGRKILSSLVEMKTWITEINPRQALLVLLLNNKKDTPNLVRYRPVLLQGIAMNRITQANELDMEIEVIERENMNKITLCEGISYLPASAENKDSLYEELCWIAKTTASDYQTTFDESSEQLLKSLLQKRKKLNPSYLRVMARYVGLGLLTPPTKK